MNILDCFAHTLHSGGVGVCQKRPLWVKGNTRKISDTKIVGSQFNKGKEEEEEEEEPGQKNNTTSAGA